MCATCKLANSGRTNPAINRVIPVKGPALRTDNLEPGDCVSVDQCMSSIHGRLPNTKGKEPKSKKFTGGTLFCDHASAHIHIVHQVSLRTGETLQAKHSHERFMATHGNTVKTHHADNKPFGDEAFVADIASCGQTIKFSGIGAHHQNVVAERPIWTVTHWTCAIMLQSIIHWPDSAGLELWHHCLNHAVHI